MKRILAIILVVVMMFSLVGCVALKVDVNDSQELKSDTKAFAYMQKYIKEKYKGFVITEEVPEAAAGFVVDGGSSFYLTEFTVKDENTTYKFYYDESHDKVYSTVNYEKILAELKEEISKNEFIKNAKSANTEICILTNDPINAIMDEHESLKDVLDYNTEEHQSHPYKFVTKIYYENLEEIKPEELRIDVDLCGKYGRYQINIFNVTEEFSKENPQEFHILDEINYYYSVNESLTIHHTHRKIDKIDDVYYAYDDRYVDCKLEKTDSYRTEDFVLGDNTYTPVNRGYKCTYTHKNTDKLNNKSDAILEFMNENQLPVSVESWTVDLVTMYWPETTKNNVLYDDCLGGVRNIDPKGAFKAFIKYEQDTTSILSLMEKK